MSHTLKWLPIAAAILMSVPPIMAQNTDEDYTKYRIGGYGEMVATFAGYNEYRNVSTGGSAYERRNTIAIPRFVLAGDYRFNRHWTLGAEIEFESGGTGVAREIEWDDENGEYETELEKGGEVALEQFHVTYSLNRYFNVRAGHMVLPVGLTNAHHEPILFFGTSRPEAETAFIPSTWHETGIAAFGTVANGLVDYQAMVVAGLNADGFRRSDWVLKGKQGAFETDNFTAPAYVIRLDFHPAQGLRVGGSVYYCANTLRNTDKETKYSALTKDVPVVITTADAQYIGHGVTARANMIWGRIGNTAELATARKSLANASGYTSRYTAAQSALSYGGEVGYDLSHSLTQLRGSACKGLIPFLRYEYYNPIQKVEENLTRFDQFQVSKWTIGVNWKPLPNLAVKLDYTTRAIGTQEVFGSGRYNHENELAIGVAYAGWFWKK